MTTERRGLATAASRARGRARASQRGRRWASPLRCRMDRSWRTTTLVRAAAVLLALTVLLVAAPEALAAGNDVGENLSSLLRRYAGQIYTGVVAIVGLVFLINRRYTDLAMFLLAAVVVGWLVFSPDDVARTARSIGDEILR